MKPNTKNNTNMIEPAIVKKLTKEVIGNRQTNDDMILIIGMFFQVKQTTDKGIRNLETRHYNRDVRTAMDNDINNINEDKRRPTYGRRQFNEQKILHQNIMSYA